MQPHGLPLVHEQVRGLGIFLGSGVFHLRQNAADRKRKISKIGWSQEREPKAGLMETAVSGKAWD